jgi:hypothetical protein
MPRTTDKRLMISSSGSLLIRSSGTVRSATFAARSRIEAALLPESPAERSACSGRVSTP